MILSDDVGDDDCIGDGTECDGVMWSREKVTWSVQQTLSRMITAAQQWTLLTAIFIVKDKTKWDKVKRCTHIRRRWQNILTKLPGVIGQARKVTTPSEAWNCLLQMKIYITLFNIPMGTFFCNLT